jgi:excisionase family DNA binding protein
MSRLTVKEAADYVRLAMSTLNALRTAGRGPRFIKLGRKVLYDTKDLDAWLDRNKRRSTSDEPQLRRRRRRSRNALDMIG